jgi:hypothetical protein
MIDAGFSDAGRQGDIAHAGGKIPLFVKKIDGGLFYILSHRLFN